jgi:uncharacterized membrane protein YgaE (UPF0421/DUF939 family)
MIAWTKVDVRSRLRHVRYQAIFAVQAGVAAGISWLIAADIFDHPHAFFAPVAAVIVLSAAAERRWRRAVDLVIGVILGIAIGDAIVALFGVGPLQIGVLVVLAMLIIAFLGRGGAAIGQAAASGVLVATIAPRTNWLVFDRFLNALVGVVVALAVMSLLLPFNPLTRVEKATVRMLSELTDALTLAGRSISRADAGLAARALATLRARDDDREALRDALTIGRETAALAPWRWRARDAVDRYAAAAVHFDRATRNVRILESRVVALLRNREPRPDELSAAIRALTDGASALRTRVVDGEDWVEPRAHMLVAAHAAGEAYRAGVGVSGIVVVAQLDAVAIELLCATGIEYRQATDIVRATSYRGLAG